MRSIRASVVTLLVMSALWYLAMRPLMNADAAPLTAPTPVSTDLDAQIPGVIAYEARDASRDTTRDLFGYVEPAPEAPIVIAAAPVTPPVVIADLAPPEPAPEPPPQFAYRYIGRFGRDADPIAAFAANGDVVTIRRGGHVGGFTLQNIGSESVDVADERGRVVRVPLNSSN
ncbi:MAG TPA: hypothetical protein VJZ00_01085 [Thermoanaerobaculia bacterium]|nr:hypothetical protein [Thermoanaerobaculia bacterium]